jgi:hypothetical protein
MAGDLQPFELDQHERRLTVRALDFAIRQRQQIEKRQQASRTWRESELTVHVADTKALQSVADRLDALPEVKS